MASRDPLLNRVKDQENETCIVLRKQAVLGVKHQPVRGGALGELGNKIHNLQKGASSESECALIGPPKPLLLKKVDVAKKGADIKVHNLKKGKENVTAVFRKPLRQESVLLSKQVLQQATKKVADSTVAAAPPDRKCSPTFPDPDIDSKDDPQMVTEYTEDILHYVRNIEVEFPLRPKLLEGTKVTSKMRSTLVNWLVDVHQNFSMGLDTLHLCVSIVDRYLQVNRTVNKGIYQLIGTSALLLASKYEEIYIPELDDFVYICDNAFTKKQLLQMELDIVKKMDFRMGWPISVFFLRRYSKLTSAKPAQHTLAKYILELGLLEYDLVHVKPSVQAAAACCLSIAIMNEVGEPSKVWSPALTFYTKYKYSDIKDVIYQFAQIISNADGSSFTAIREKYSSSKYGKISHNIKLRGPLIRKLASSLSLVKK